MPLLPDRAGDGDYLERYTEEHTIHVLQEAAVHRVERAGTRFTVMARDIEDIAYNVVVATGSERQPRVPDLARDLDPGTRQMHSSRHHDPASCSPARSRTRSPPPPGQAWAVRPPPGTRTAPSPFADRGAPAAERGDQTTDPVRGGRTKSVRVRILGSVAGGRPGPLRWPSRCRPYVPHAHSRTPSSPGARRSGAIRHVKLTLSVALVTHEE